MKYKFRKLNPENGEEEFMTVEEKDLTEEQLKMLLQDLVNHFRNSPQIVKTGLRRILKKNPLM